MSKQLSPVAIAIRNAIAEIGGAKTAKAKKAFAIDAKFVTKVEKFCAKFGVDSDWLVISDEAGHKAYISEDGLDRLMVFFASTEIKDVKQFQQLNTYTQISALIANGETVAEETAPVELEAATETDVTEVTKAEVVLALPEAGKPVLDANGDWIFMCVRSGKIGYANEFFVPTYDLMRREMNKARVDFVDLPHFAIHQDAVEDSEMPNLRLLTKMADSISAEEARIAKAQNERRQQDADRIEQQEWKKFRGTVYIGTKGLVYKGVEMARCVNRDDTVGPVADMRVPRLPAMYARFGGRYPTEKEMREQLLCCPFCHQGEGMPLEDAITAIARIQVAALLKR